MRQTGNQVLNCFLLLLMILGTISGLRIADCRPAQAQDVAPTISSTTPLSGTALSNQAKAIGESTASATKKQKSSQLVLQILEITPDTLPTTWSDLGPASTANPTTPKNSTTPAQPTATPLKITLKVENRGERQLRNLNFRIRVSNGLPGTSDKLLNWLNHHSNHLINGSVQLAVDPATEPRLTLKAKQAQIITLTVKNTAMSKLKGLSWGGHQLEVSVIGDALERVNQWNGRSLLLVTPDQAKLEQKGQNLPKVKVNPILPVTAPTAISSDFLINNPTAGQSIEKTPSGAAVKEGNSNSDSDAAAAKKNTSPQLAKSGTPMKFLNTLPQNIATWSSPVSWLIDPSILSTNSPWNTEKLRPLSGVGTNEQLNTAVVNALKSLPATRGPKYLDWWGGVAIDRLSNEQIRLAKAWSDRIDQQINGSGTQIDWHQLPVFSEAELHSVRSARLYTLEPSRLAVNPQLSALLAEGESTQSFTSRQLLRTVLAQLAQASDKTDNPVVTILLPADTLYETQWQQRWDRIQEDPWVKIDTSVTSANHEMPTQADVSWEQDLIVDPNPQAAQPVVKTSDNTSENASDLPVSDNQTAWFLTGDNKETLIYQGKEQSLLDFSHQVSAFNQALSLFSTQAVQVLHPLNQQALLSYQRYFPAHVTSGIWNNLSEQLAQFQKGIELQSVDQVNLIATHAEIPVKVRNHFPIPVRVEVVLKPLSSRLKAQATAKVKIAPGSSATARIPVSAVGNGNVTARLFVRFPAQPATGDPDTTPPADLSQYAAIFESVQDPDQGSAATYQVGMDNWLPPSKIVIRIRAAWEDRLFTGFAIVVAIIFVVGLAQSILRSDRFARNRRLPGVLTSVSGAEAACQSASTSPVPKIVVKPKSVPLSQATSSKSVPRPKVSPKSRPSNSEETNLDH